ncbi:hypothetical protein HII31_05169 [Pseudocercospora fuligena]|uniref:Sulfotransferase family protein n=1 Tax=Pseudocercospora fuligena TaxID=685502 RepID=A0A8H6VJ36_9PEZI|nr:hypothetical protein HII31_05169 [Pseudocercospora fuligena]
MATLKAITGLIDENGNDTYIDRTQCHRDRPMEVLCLGPGRTGTDSMRVALKILGFDDCYHGYSGVAENPPDNYMWNRAMDYKLLGKGTFGKQEWDQLLGHCRAVSDLPCVLFSKELIETYPEAKVILTYPPKGFDRWHESCCNTIVALRDDITRDAWGLVNHESKLTRDTFFRSFDAFWRGDFKKHAREVFDDHVAEIKALVPPEQLFEYDVTQGWEPLCEFLNVPLPEEEFPSGNDP